MSFSSTTFLFIFLPITTTFYFIFRRNKFLRNLLLLLASLLFYIWGELHLTLFLILSISINYIVGYLLSCAKSWRKSIFVVGVIFNIALLCFFKYFNFFMINMNLACEFIGVPTFVIPPIPALIGISFFTFQALSYIIDVYGNKYEYERNPLILSLYISFFPKLVSGPIMKFSDFKDQSYLQSNAYADVAAGIQRFIIGLAKKVLIANALGRIVDPIYALSNNELTASIAWLGMLSFTLQIFFDFSGYTDMAIGLGKIFGFNMPENFNYPYISRSIQEFWRRWHTTLSQWFRDYLYIPLGGNRNKPIRVYVNLMIVFFLCGLWHGASWTFVVWGLFHGFFLIIERIGFSRILERIPYFLRNLYALIAVMVGWVFFRSETLLQALEHIKALAGFGKGTGIWINSVRYMTEEVIIVLIIAIILSTPLPHLIGAWITTRLEEHKESAGAMFFINLVHHSLILFLLFLSIISISAGTQNSFIYFKF